jgi:G3E family GTPase
MDANRADGLLLATMFTRQGQMRLPLTVLAGPSTSWRDDLVRCLVLRRPGLAALVYEVVPGGVVRRVLDAAGQQHQEPLDLHGCCLSCTVLDDVTRGLSLVVDSDRWSEVLLALPASAQPADLLPVLHAFESVRVDTVTTVVDARLLLAQVTGDDLLADRGLAAAPTDRRSTAELVVGQLESADVLALVDLHRTGTEQARTACALLAHLAPLAAQVVIGPGGAGCDEVVSTGRHEAETSGPDREQLAALAVELCPPLCGVTTVHWSSAQPVHSGRLSCVLEQVLHGVVRSRGHIWLADRPTTRLRWESAGAGLAMGDASRWDGAAPRSSLVLTGVQLDASALVALLDSCLCSPEELSGRRRWIDPFEGALGPATAAESG